MAANVGYATLQIIPSARGFGSALNKETSAPLAAGGKAGGKKFGGGLAMGALPGAKMLGGALAAIGVGKVVKDAVNLEATFSQTMNTMGAVAGVPKRELRSLSDLALKLGADTSFSAGEAADAMLELAKSGIKPADIQAGALAGTLTLAAAGGTDLGTAATIASNAMNTFNLSGAKMDSIAAALAGGANASSASVESLGQALQQVGPGATNAGLSLQQTVGVLSAFDAAGIKGSDAGTSLKTALTRLIPTTDKARGAMRDLGLNFTNADGSFKSITNVAQQLHEKLKPLPEAQRSAALATIFGADAARAATVLMNEGAKGIQGYIKATKDKGAAEEAAAARMAGTSGAMERLSGSIETAKLQLGLFLAPAIVSGADLLGAGIDKVGSGIAALSGGLKGSNANFSAFSSTMKAVVDFARPLGDTLLGIGRQIMAVLRPAISSISGIFMGQLLPAFQAFLPAVQPIANFLLKVFGSAVVGVLKGVVNVVKGVLKTLAGIFNVFAGLLTGDWGRLWNGIKQIASGVFSAIVGAVQIFWNGSILAIFKKGALFLTKGIWTKLWSSIKSLAKSGMNAAKSAISSAWAAIKAVFSNALSAVVNFVKSRFNTAKSIVSASMAFTRSKIAGAWTAIRSLVSNAVSGILGRVRSGFGNMVSAIRNLIGNAVDVVRGLPGRALSALGSIGTKLYGAGKNLIQGFINGVKAVAGNLIAAVTAPVQGAINKAKGLLGINSPSRVFMEIGAFTSEGMALGIQKGAPKVAKAAAALGSVRPVTAGTASVAWADGGAPALSSNDSVAALLESVEGLRADIRRMPKDYRLGDRRNRS